MVSLKLQLRDGDIRYVEALLYQQKTHDGIIAAAQAEIDEMLPAYSTSVVKFSHDEGMVGDSQPEKWAIIRNESVRAKELHGEIRKRRRQKEAISAAIETLNDVEAQLVFMRYHLEKSHKQCAKALQMWSDSRRDPSQTYWRTRKKVLEKVARFVLM